MRAGMVVCAVLALCGSAVLSAGDVNLKEVTPVPSELVRGEFWAGEVAATPAAWRGHRLEAELVAVRSMMDRLRATRPAGDGGGASIGQLTVIQLAFKESNCQFRLDPADPASEPLNVVLLIWDTPTPNPLGVDVIFDGEPLTMVEEDGMVHAFLFDGGLASVGPKADPGDPEQLFLFDVPAGVHTFKIEEGNEGTSSEVELEVLDAQPFADAENVVLDPAAVEADSCMLVAGYDNVCPVADRYTIFLDDADGNLLQPFGRISWLPWLVIRGAPPGSYGARVRGFADYNGDPNAQYFGCFVDGDADRSTPEPDPLVLNCDPTPCVVPPSNFRLTQMTYGGATGPHDFMAVLTPGEVYSGGLNFYLDDALLANLPADSIPHAEPEIPDTVFITFGLNLAPGEYTFAFEGECGADGTSDRAENTFTIRADTPHPEPVDGEILCEWDQDTATTNASWTNKDCSTYIQRFLITDPENDPEGVLVGDRPNDQNDFRIEGNRTEDGVIDTTPDDLLDYRFITWVDGDQYSSERIRCVTELPPTDFFIRGICNDGSVAATNPQLTDGIFVLNFLFQGGPTPGCMEACDTNASGDLNLTDGVYIFGYLFLGGPPPPPWQDGNPTCEEIGEGIDCATPNASCPLE